MPAQSGMRIREATVAESEVQDTDVAGPDETVTLKRNDLARALAGVRRMRRRFSRIPQIARLLDDTYDRLLRLTFMR